MIVMYKYHVLVAFLFIIFATLSVYALIPKQTDNTKDTRMNKINQPDTINEQVQNKNYYFAEDALTVSLPQQTNKIAGGLVENSYITGNQKSTYSYYENHNTCIKNDEECYFLSFTVSDFMNNISGNKEQFLTNIQKNRLLPDDKIVNTHFGTYNNMTSVNYYVTTPSRIHDGYILHKNFRTIMLDDFGIFVVTLWTTSYSADFDPSTYFNSLKINKNNKIQNKLKSLASKSERAKWKSILNWSEECEDRFINSKLDIDGINIYPVNKGEKIIQVTCNMGAYQGTHQLYYYNQVNNNSNKLNFKQFSFNKNGEIEEIINNEFVGNAHYDIEKQELSYEERYRGIGDCGVWAIYKLSDDRELVIKEAWGKHACDGGERGKFPQIYPKQP